ncbi:MAG: helix-turn-helix transcriptional regulator [Acidimicrobiales bacterium]
MADSSSAANEPEAAPRHDADILEFPGGDRTTRLRDVIGEVLREERHRQGRTLADVADAAAVSVQYLSEVERGRKEVSSDVLHAIHQELGIDLGELLDRSTRRLRPRAQHRGPVMLAA